MINKKITNSGSSSIFLFILAGLVGVIILIYYMVSTNVIPSYNEYIAQDNPDVASSTQDFQLQLARIDITTPTGIIHSFLATSTDDQEKGLGGISSLLENEGMIFAFTTSASRGFWMLDMKIPLDMVWIRENKTVAGITSNISPNSYPDIFLPPEPVMYVLELNAGTAEKYGMATGTPLTFVL